MTNVDNDIQVVGETTTTLFSFSQPGPLAALVIMANLGTNTINYDFQQFDGANWGDIQPVGGWLNTTLQAGQVATIRVTATYPLVRLTGNASGGATLSFSVTRWGNRPSGGSLPQLC
jgi:hypothetical protein